MSKTIMYIGAVRRWPELATTGRQSIWFPGQAEQRSDSEAAQLLATGLFSDVDATQLTEQKAVQISGLVSEARNADLVDRSTAAALIRAGVFYPMTTGFVSGTDLAESANKGPNITVAGTTAAVFANAGWFTHDAGGNTQQIKANAYVDGITDMTTEGAIILGMDFYCTTWPSATETLWSIGRPTDQGGIRMPLTSGGPGVFAIYYRASGAGSETILSSYAKPSAYTATRLSVLVELHIVPSLNELRIATFINGRMEASNVATLGTPPAVLADSGLNFSGQGQTPLQKLGTSGTGVRTANAFAFRHSGTDRNIAGRLAAAIYANTALPSWLTRI